MGAVSRPNGLNLFYSNCKKNSTSILNNFQPIHFTAKLRICAANTRRYCLNDSILPNAFMRLPRSNWNCINLHRHSQQLRLSLDPYILQLMHILKMTSSLIFMIFPKATFPSVKFHKCSLSFCII